MTGLVEVRSAQSASTATHGASPAAGAAAVLVDGKTGLMAVFAYDKRGRVLRPKQVRAVADAFDQ